MLERRCGMPTRMIRDWTDSSRFDGISAEAERLFCRLLLKADDYGRFHADPRLVCSLCFPFGGETPQAITRNLDELERRGLVVRYQAESGRPVLAIPRYGQRLKQSRAKFPPPAGKPGDWLPDQTDFRELPGTSGNFPSESEYEEEEEHEEKRKDICPEGTPKRRASRPSIPVISDEQVFIRIPVIGTNGVEYPVSREKVAEWTELFPGVDIEGTLREIRAWNLANTDRRKTAGGVDRHIVKWLTREQNQGGRR